MDYYLGVDLGTSYFKAGLFDEAGRLHGLGCQYVKKIIKDDITCELPVDVFRETLRCCIGEAMQAANATPKEIRSISYSSQANSFVLLDSNYKPLTPLVLWPDKRADGFGVPAGLLNLKAEFQEKTGLGFDPNPQLGIAKIMWFQKMLPRLWKNVRSIMTISDYLVF
jgi:xylulokinase